MTSGTKDFGVFEKRAEISVVEAGCDVDNKEWEGQTEPRRISHTRVPRCACAPVAQYSHLCWLLFTFIYVCVCEQFQKTRNNGHSRGKRFTFQSTVRQLERRRLAEKLSREADFKEQQRRTELEAMRRVEEEFQRKRAREKANIRQQLRLVSSGAASMPVTTSHTKTRDEPDGSCRESSASERNRDGRQRHSNASSEISGRSKSTTPIRSVELSEWRGSGSARVYRDWAPAPPVAAAAIAHPPACARMPMSAHVVYNAAAEVEAFSGSPRSDNYRLEFARGRSPRTPRPPRLVTAARTPSTSGSELSLRQPIKIRESTKEEDEEPAIVPTIRPSGPRRAVITH
ncbi:uncharacterized protein LOC131849458 [Achroia grisella]|uniref:uncharacterized protein LOC131849458 n=1 Tax=Achroia grisella TaxID=688607 RepID=UPI0027D2C2AB|nr:uncharacterized protein LOC131849458 [Achroia grisella]